MQLSRGAGLAELISFEEFSKKDKYQIFKPLINFTKDELLHYLQKNDIKYFVDSSNFEDKYRRNYFRKNYSTEFINEFKEGVKKSFGYLQNDLESLNINKKPLLNIKELEIYKITSDDNINIRIIDKNLKKRGLLLSKAQRDEILKQREIVISHKIATCLTEEFIYICPFIKKSMPKKFKEKCRINKIPKNTRPYIFINDLIEEVCKIIN